MAGRCLVVSADLRVGSDARIVAWADATGPVARVRFGGAVATWVAGFDIIYACQDVEFDRQAKLYSVPARFGVAGALRMACGIACAQLVAACLVARGWTRARSKVDLTV